jgi:hypothetical protein
VSLSRHLKPYLWCVAALTCSLGILSCGDCVETPSLSSITPNNAVAGSPSIELVVEGNHFQRNSTILWNSAALTSTFISGHQLKAVISAENLAESAVAQVQVFNPPPSQPVTLGSNTVNPLSTNANTMVHADCVGGNSRVMDFTIMQ